MALNERILNHNQWKKIPYFFNLNYGLNQKVIKRINFN